MRTLGRESAAVLSALATSCCHEIQRSPIHPAMQVNQCLAVYIDLKHIIFVRFRSWHRGKVIVVSQFSHGKSSCTKVDTATGVYANVAETWLCTLPCSPKPSLFNAQK
jgi:hypothetical protein